MSQHSACKNQKRQEPDHLDLLHNRMSALNHSLARIQEMQRTSPLAATTGGLTAAGPSSQFSSSDLSQKILGLLKKHAGIQSNDALRNKVDRLIQDQTAASLMHRIFNEDGHAGDGLEWQQVLEKLTVHETYFYRDGSQMDMVREEFLRPRIRELAKSAAPHLRIWSAATSTGEEAYTLAILTVLELIALQEARLTSHHEIFINSRWTVDILGTDISNRVLSHGRKGCYQHNGSLSPFRELPKEMWGFFQPQTGAQEGEYPWFQVIPAIRRMVRFQQHNLNSGQPAMEHADLVVCRNVMIYFDEHTKLAVQKGLYQALQPAGCLVLGPSDSNLLPDRYLAQWGKKSVFYLRHAD